MNRHQSNPFLAGWEESDDVQTQVGGVFDISATIQNDENRAIVDENNSSGEVANARRHSSSQADVTGNPFGANRSTDRRLYHRNMSSFEAASLQLEHQQQMLENKNDQQISGNQTDLIAKMTADFQSAIDSNDKEFAIGQGTLGEGENAIELSAFDPFETIVDDDISLPSPKTVSNVKANNRQPEEETLNGSNEDEGYNFTSRAEHMDLDVKQQAAKSTHDSIDDDDEELVSTPVRNIKSSSPQKPQGGREDSVDSKGELRHLDDQETDFNAESNNNSKFGEDYAGDCDQPSPKDPENTQSMTKASLFSSLLASAESGGQQQQAISNDSNNTADEGADPNNPNNLRNNAQAEDESEPLRAVEHGTHVIMGSTTDGNLDRPVGFFDPFETVIDKDALTSLMNDNQHSATQVTKSTEDDQEDDDDGFIRQTKTPESTPIHRPPEDGSKGRDLLYSRYGVEYRSGLNEESVSVETVIENAPSSHSNVSQSSANSTTVGTNAANAEQQSSATSSSQQQQQQGDHESRDEIAVDERSQSCAAVPRPAAKNQASKQADQQAPLAAHHDLPKSTPSRKPKQKKKPSSFQEDSSDSSDDDDRIQIVIKARDTKLSETSAAPTFVPLLPPPPSKSSMKQARERGQVEDMPSPVMSYKTRHGQRIGAGAGKSDSSDEERVTKLDGDAAAAAAAAAGAAPAPETDEFGAKCEKVAEDGSQAGFDDDDSDDHGGQFVIPMTHSDDEGEYGKPDTPLYDEDTSYVLEEFPAKYEGPGWDMMLRYPPKKKLTSNRFWKKIFVKLAQVPLAPPDKSNKSKETANEAPQTCIALQVFDKAEDKKPMQEIPIQATYTVSEISSQQFDQFGKIFTIKLQYIFYKERVGVRQGQLARFIHSGHIGSSTTSGGHGADPLSIGAIKRLGAPIEHSPQISQIIKLGCASYSDIKQFKNCLEDYLFKMPIHRDRALSTYRTEEVQMAVRDETYLELNQVGTIIRQMARVRLFFLSFLNGMPIVEVGINDIHRQGREVVGRMDILPVVTEEWIRLEACDLHSTVEKEEFENPDSRIIKLVPPDATFFELLRFRIRPPRNRELPLQISANMTVTRTKVSINCDVMVPGSVSRKHGQIPCEDIAIRVYIPECWIYFFREEKHFRMGSKKSVNRRPGKVKGIERFLGGGGLQDINNESSLIEVTSGQAKYEHHHHAIVWRASRWPKEGQAAYLQNTMKIRLPLTAYDKMPENFYEFVHVEYTMPATTVSHTTLRSISVNPCDDEPPEKYVKYSAKYEYKVKMRLSINFGLKPGEVQPEASPIVIMKQPDLHGDLQREEDSDEGSDADTSDQGDHAADH